MVSAINPMSECSRGYRYWLTACWFIVGSVLGGALLGVGAALGAGLVSWMSLPPVVAVLTAAVCCLACLFSDSGTVGVHLPLHPRQVNERWLMAYRRWVYASGFGFQIGVGFATYVMSAAVYLVPVLGVLSGSPALAIALGLTFGAVRGLAVLLTSRVRDPAALFELHRRLDRWAGPSRTAVMVVMAGAAAALAAVAAGPLAAVVLALIALGAVVPLDRSGLPNRRASAR